MSTREKVDGAWDGKMPPTGLQLAKLLKGLNDGETPLPAFVHKANAYAAPPQDLVKGRRSAPGTAHGIQGSFYFYSDPPPVMQGRRTRKVPGGSWHSEKTESWDFVEKEMHLSCLAYKRTFSYIVKSPPGMKRHRGRQRTGWIMAEISLDEHGNGADNMVLCVVHKSTHKYPDTSMAPGSSTGEGATPRRDDKASVHQSLGLKCAAAPVQAAEKAARTTDKCGLHRSGSLEKSEELQHDAIIKELTPNEREGVVYCGERISSTITTAYVNVLGKKLQQELNDLEDAVTEGVEKEFPVDTSGSGVKRKADDSEHTDAPPAARQERMDTGSTSALEETERATFPAENDPMPDGGDQDWNLNNILELEDITDVELTPDRADDNSGDSARFVAAGMPRTAEEYYQQEPIGVDDGFWDDLPFSILDGAFGDDEALRAEASQHQL